MDIEKIAKTIDAIEKEQSQLEYRVGQYKNQKDKLEKELATVGITAEELDSKINELNLHVEEKMTQIEAFRAKG